MIKHDDQTTAAETSPRWTICLRGRLLHSRSLNVKSLIIGGLRVYVDARSASGINTELAWGALARTRRAILLSCDDKSDGVPDLARSPNLSKKHDSH